jgi:hypothetical protein
VWRAAILCAEEDGSGMLEQYKKNLARMQITIGLVTWAVAARTHEVAAAIAFFVTMQIGAILGALLAAQLKNRITRARGRSRA